MVFVGLVIACRLAGSPIFRSPFSTNATIEGVVILPSLLGITTGLLPSITATQEFVVPKSIPIIFPINKYFLFVIFFVALCKINKQKVCHFIINDKLAYFLDANGVVCVFSANFYVAVYMWGLLYIFAC